MHDATDVSPLLPAHEWPPLRTQAELPRRWRALVGPLGFSFRRLWLLFLEPETAPWVTSPRSTTSRGAARGGGGPPVRLAPLHLANDEVVVPLTGDDLIVSRSGNR